MFSVFHLFAFPWKVYDIRRSEIVASESAPGFLPDPKTAYSGGFMGSRALMDAFNPWDLVKNIGRGFRWLFVGRRSRLTDISYQKSTLRPGLEPTRNQLTAFDGNNSLDEGPRPYAPAGKPAHYHTISDSDDADRLLTHAQPTARDPSPSPPTYPRPMDRLPHRTTPTAAGDIATMGVYDPPPPSHNLTNHSSHTLPYPSQKSGVIDPSTQSLSTTDTSYHGASSHTHRRNLTPTAIPPDPHPLGPPGRNSFEGDEWDM